MLTAMMVVRIVMMIMVAFAVVFVRMRVRVMMMGPGRERVGKTAPALRALTHLRVAQETGVERGHQALSIDFERHDHDGLAAIAERFLPLLSSVLGHFSFADVSIARRPPGSCGRAMKISPCQVQAADFVHA